MSEDDDRITIVEAPRVLEVRVQKKFLTHRSKTAGDLGDFEEELGKSMDHKGAGFMRTKQEARSSPPSALSPPWCASTVQTPLRFSRNCKPQCCHHVMVVCAVHLTLGCL